MAKYTLPEDVSRMKGSRGGSTFQKSGQVFSIRKRNVPVQKRSIKQSQSKNTFEHVQSNFRTLTPSEQSNIGGQAGDYERTDSLGNVYAMTAGQMFASSNINLVNSGLPIVKVIPDPVVYPVFDFNSIALIASEERVEFELEISIVPDGFTMFAFTSAILSNGTSDIASQELKLIHVYAEGDDTGLNVYTDFIKAWGTWENRTGLSVWVRIIFSSNDTGQKSPVFEQLVGVAT